MRSEGLTAKQIDDLASHQSGLLGVSAFSPEEIPIAREALARVGALPEGSEERTCNQA